MPRLLPDWITGFLQYTDHMEAPRFMRTWSAISAIASALRRRVWIDEDQFLWTPSLYIVFVGPPGVITKSTTTDMSSELLREIPGIRFGPNNITWQALATSFAAAGESFEYPLGSGEWHPMSAITLISRELGSLLNPRDQDLVNLFIELYDGSKRYEKATKGSGSDTVERPWINLLGATTPSWIADNVPQSALGGGLISRIIFLYGDRKEKMVHRPSQAIPDREAHARLHQALIHDLEHISASLLGPFDFSREADAWMKTWYEHLWSTAEVHYTDDKMMGFIARKQTHLCKVAMCLSAAHKDELVITLDDIQLADQLLSAIEGSLDSVFSQIGRTSQSVAAQRLLDIVHRAERIPWEKAYRLMYTYFPDLSDYEGICAGAIRSGHIRLWQNPKDGVPYLVWCGEEAGDNPIAVTMT